MVELNFNAADYAPAWLPDEDAPPTPAEQRAEANRKAQERRRLREENHPLEISIKAAYDAYLEACRERKEAMRELGREIERKYNAWKALAARR